MEWILLENYHNYYFYNVAESKQVPADYTLIFMAAIPTVLVAYQEMELAKVANCHPPTQ